MHNRYMGFLITLALCGCGSAASGAAGQLSADVGAASCPPSGTAPCDDGNACTTGDTCVQGVCKGGAALDCPAGTNACINVGCNPKSGCTQVANDAKCDDGNACTVGEACTKGVCAAGSKLECSDDNPCTDDLCLQASGCVHAVNKASCDDGKDCTSADVCVSGACVGGTPVLCDDTNDCTDDFCAQGAGCVHAAIAAPCDDGDACTAGDACVDKVCKGAQPVDCSDGTPCTTDGCASTKGCLHGPAAGACEDGNACTSADQCAGGACVGGAATDCNDLEACTIDVCDAAKGCQHVSTTAPCDDGDACTAGDTCVAKACKGAVKDCGDGTTCTSDGCDSATGCLHSAVPGECEDGNACTAGDQCAGGVCVGGAAVNCDDQKGCTEDSCAAVGGCQHLATTAPCEDGDACTVGDACAGGACAAGAAADCGDGDPCTTDACAPPTGCTHTDNSASCQDGDACTTGDTCKDGTCIGGAAPDCNDKALCTDDSCDKKLGCVHKNNAAQCDDGDACTLADACTEGSCKGGTALDCADTNPCTTDLCDKKLGCLYGLNTDPCAFEDACGLDAKCSSGLCIFSAWKACDDNNVCSDDGCITGQCWHSANASLCDDGNPCSVEDKCNNQACTLSQPKSCDDKDACTVDSCDGTSGACVHTPFTNQCDDNNVCTDDSCVPASGCQHAANTAACDLDASKCTVDVCAQKACKAGPPLPCADGNECTDDACEAKTGCTFTNNFKQCGYEVIGGCDNTWRKALCGGGTCTWQDWCDDGSYCTTDSQTSVYDWTCESDISACSNVPKPALTPCGVPNVCNETGVCVGPWDLGMGYVAPGPAAIGCKPGQTCTADAMPAHIATLSGYLIDVKEVTVADYKACVSAGACTVTAALPDCDYAEVGADNWPINCVNWSQADKFCTWKQGKRLPSEAEWEKAARGGCELNPGADCIASTRLYPWGNATPSCDLTSMGIPTDACGVGHPLPGGSKPGDLSPYGAFDMGGNLMEWTADWYSATYYEISPSTDPAGPATGTDHPVRGGQLWGADTAFYASNVRKHSVPTKANFFTGLRCARSYP